MLRRVVLLLVLLVLLVLIPAETRLGLLQGGQTVGEAVIPVALLFGVLADRVVFVVASDGPASCGGERAKGPVVVG